MRGRAARTRTRVSASLCPPAAGPSVPQCTGHGDERPAPVPAGATKTVPCSCPPAARRPRPRSLVRVFCVWAILGEEMCLNHLSTSPCPPAFAGPSTAASLSHCRNRSGNLERNLWTASNEMEARADESFEVFSSGRSSVSFGGGTRICSFVAQYFVPVTARGLAITPDHV
ncbi:uncharacterized protein LOC120506873 isoform X2 [Passer montanus]|uniref:uncharacterized protein LOC120506873 isoform X2 n=1 Tax=Passer montanus TaxID=9160 RepID=UPI001960B98B|nr:uncharacterized protein LOC120506873 isoform X2 [Passer montanus]